MASTFEVNEEPRDNGIGGHAYSTIVQRVRGVRATYGPGGWAIGIIPAGRSGRREFQGPIVEGPWGYLFGRSAVIDNAGGTARDLALAKIQGRLIDEVGDGDVLILSGTRYVVSVRSDGDVRLDPEPEPVFFDCANCGQLAVTAAEKCPDATLARITADLGTGPAFHDPKHLHGDAYVPGCAACQQAV